MAECHPVGFQWVVEAKARGAKVIHVDPRFTRTSALADIYVPIRAGSDIVFLGAIIKVADREMVLQGPVAAAVGQIADSIDLRRDLDVRLTGREREVLAVAAEGLTARQIATRLGVRERTVTTHLGRIYGKLGVGNRLSAIRMAARSGMVSVGSAE